ncbi:MAG: beta-N-acetylglucosaminidase domain-containing protein [Psychromonas sp.]|nr:beta-N-acetylglucosaminidase domain-containing protein [Psychromonas sp.]
MSTCDNTLCGIIMGYYGPIWSEDALIDYASFCKNNNLTTFIYGPKMDNYLRKDWQQNWPATEFQSLLKIRAAFKAADVKFGMAFSPYNVDKYDNTIQKALEHRIGGDQFKQLNLDVLVIGFDDISADVVARTGSKLAGIQIDVTQYIQTIQLGINSKTQFYVVPSYYSLSPVIAHLLGPIPKNYLEDYGTIDSKIGILWTGSEVIPNGFSIEEIEEINAKFKRKVTLWDNYPVNDPSWMIQSTANVYPFTGRPYKLVDHISGHFANPMIQPYLSQIPLSTLPRIYSERANYIPQQEFLRAAQKFCAGSSNNHELANYIIEELMSFRELTSRPDYGLTIERLQNNLKNLQGAPKIKAELAQWLKYANTKGGSGKGLPTLATIHVSNCNNQLVLVAYTSSGASYVVAQLNYTDNKPRTVCISIKANPYTAPALINDNSTIQTTVTLPALQGSETYQLVGIGINRKQEAEAPWSFGFKLNNNPTQFKSGTGPNDGIAWYSDPQSFSMCPPSHLFSERIYSEPENTPVL